MGGEVLLLSESFFKSIQKHESLGGRVLCATEMLCGYRTTLQHKQIWGFTQLNMDAGFSWAESIILSNFCYPCFEIKISQIQHFLSCVFLSYFKYSLEISSSIKHHYNFIMFFTEDLWQHRKQAAENEKQRVSNYKDLQEHSCIILLYRSGRNVASIWISSFVFLHFKNVHWFQIPGFCLLTEGTKLFLPGATVMV